MHVGGGRKMANLENLGRKIANGENLSQICHNSPKIGQNKPKYA